MPSRVPEVIDALVARLSADEELVGVLVEDGPQVTQTKASDWLLVGWDGDPTGNFQAAQTTGGWASLATDREEQIQLVLVAISIRGDTDVKAARERAYAIGARVEVLLRADPGIGLPSLQAAIEQTQLVQDQTENGAQARLLLTLAVNAFI